MPTIERDLKASDSERLAECIRVFTGGEDATGEAFTVLHGAYRMLLIGFVQQKFRSLQYAEVEDIVQETFLLATQHAANFRGEARFDVWLCSIAYHQAQERFRGKASGQVNLADERKYLLQGKEPTGEDHAIRDETVAKVRKAIRELPYEWRDVVQDVEIEGMKYEECSEHLHLPIGTVRSQLHRARAILKESLQSIVRQAS